jgi:hypothetical protein
MLHAPKENYFQFGTLHLSGGLGDCAAEQLLQIRESSSPYRSMLFSRVYSQQLMISVG